MWESHTVFWIRKILSQECFCNGSCVIHSISLHYLLTGYSTITLLLIIRLMGEKMEPLHTPTHTQTSQSRTSPSIVCKHVVSHSFIVFFPSFLSLDISSSLSLCPRAVVRWQRAAYITRRMFRLHLCSEHSQSLGRWQCYVRGQVNEEKDLHTQNKPFVTNRFAFLFIYLFLFSIWIQGQLWISLQCLTI